MSYFLAEALHASGSEWWQKSYHFVKDATQAPNIAFVIVWLILPHFRAGIKCANLFMTKSGMVKLGDLNVSKVAKRGMMYT
jgi:hypothetical protein